MTDLFRLNYVDLNDSNRHAMKNIKMLADELASYIRESSLPCREASLAITKLEESVMWAVKALTSAEAQL